MKDSFTRLIYADFWRKVTLQMIIDFSVANYRSIKEEVTLSFVAQKGRGTSKNGQAKEAPDDAICPGFAIEGRDFKLLPVVALFGPNASGKSNVLKALDALLLLMQGTRVSRFLERSFTPFRLDPKTAHSPSEFQIRFAVSGQIFTYETAVKAGIITRESLEYSPAGGKRQSVRQLFSRTWNEEKKRYDVKTGEAFAGSHTQLLDKVQPSESYFSVLLRLDVELLKPLIGCVRTRFSGLFIDEWGVDELIAASVSYEHDKHHEVVKSALRIFDIGLDDVKIEKRGDGDQESYDIWAIHHTATGDVRWSFKEESLGTQRLFSLQHYLIFALLCGTALTVDEFGSNFHPRISREIINLFQDPKTNSKGAQLIATSHDNTLWRGNLLRRDQIWLTEKRADGGTRLFSLSDYKVRSTAALDKAYLDGRFGAVPIVASTAEVMQSIKDERDGVAEEVALEQA